MVPAIDPRRSGGFRAQLPRRIMVVLGVSNNQFLFSLSQPTRIVLHSVFLLSDVLASVRRS